jgi:non-heme chloroperoxidase
VLLKGDWRQRAACGPFYSFNRPGAEPNEAVIQNWWRQGIAGGAKAHYDGIAAFSQTETINADILAFLHA